MPSGESFVLVLVLTVLLAPDAFRAGVESWVHVQTSRVFERMAPLLPDTDAAETVDGVPQQ